MTDSLENILNDIYWIWLAEEEITVDLSAIVVNVFYEKQDLVFYCN